MSSVDAPSHRFSINLEAYDKCAAVFEALTKDAPYALKEEWESDQGVKVAEPLYLEDNEGTYVVARDGDAVFKVYRSRRGEVAASVRGATGEGVRRTMAWLKQSMPLVPTDKDAVKFDFVRLRTSGLVERRTRGLMVPRFDEIRENYAPATRDALEGLLRTRLDDGISGRIVIWHGPPGTGKTYMLRALAREWQDRARIVYVVDPENFFSGSTDYIMSVLLDDEDDEDPDKWTVVVLEDTGELFTAAGAAHVHHGLARLLNFSDGVLGQGLRCLFLLTTNERIHQLHKAITRPGRCLANIYFAPFAPPEARVWLKGKGIRGPTGPEPVLAELFAMAERHGSIRLPAAPAQGVEVQ